MPAYGCYTFHAVAEEIEKMAKTTIKENVTNIVGVPTWTVVLLQRILEITGKNHIHEVWPNLEVFIHGAVSFEWLG